MRLDEGQHVRLAPGGTAPRDDRRPSRQRKAAGPVGDGLGHEVEPGRFVRHDGRPVPVDVDPPVLHVGRQAPSGGGERTLVVGDSSRIGGGRGPFAGAGENEYRAARPRCRGLDLVPPDALACQDDDVRDGPEPILRADDGPPGALAQGLRAAHRRREVGPLGCLHDDDAGTRRGARPAALPAAARGVGEVGGHAPVGDGEFDPFAAGDADEVHHGSAGLQGFERLRLDVEAVVHHHDVPALVDGRASGAVR